MTLSGQLGGNQDVTLSGHLGGIQDVSLSGHLGGIQDVSLGAPRACLRIPCRDARPGPLLAVHPIG